MVLVPHSGGAGIKAWLSRTKAIDQRNVTFTQRATFDVLGAHFSCALWPQKQSNQFESRPLTTGTINCRRTNYVSSNYARCSSPAAGISARKRTVAAGAKRAGQQRGQQL
jgi:hypothetical protein